MINPLINSLLNAKFKRVVNIMRLTVLFLLIGIAASHATAIYSQSTQLTVNVNNKTVKEVFDEIERNSEYIFFYYDGILDVNRKVNIRAKKQTVNKILDQLFESTDNTYSINNRQIFISRSESTSENANIQQSKTITGVVKDDLNEPIIGANILIKGTSTGVITDIDGRFTLEVPTDAILLISYIGYVSREIIVGNQTNINVTLSEDAKAIEEVVVIGYGSVKKSNLTGAVSSIKTTELQQTPMTSIDQGLVGRASGVQVTQTSGMPGAVASIRVRGSSSLQGGNEPLYVIDGFPVYSGTGFGETGGKNQMSGLATVNPSDIESIEILKDASATAIYGARAANGVVLITTKSGKKGRDVVTFESSWGVQTVAKKLDVMNAQEYAALINEAYTNDGLTPYYNDTQLAEIARMGKGTD
jgi:TonB-dependent SusC/RagA subfamily outer membrane receptor